MDPVIYIYPFGSQGDQIFVISRMGDHIVVSFLLKLCSLSGAEKPGGHRDCGGVRCDTKTAGPLYYSPALIEVGYFLFTLLLPLVFKLWDLFM